MNIVYWLVAYCICAVLLHLIITIVTIVIKEYSLSEYQFVYVQISFILKKMRIINSIFENVL